MIKHENTDYKLKMKRAYPGALLCVDLDGTLFLPLMGEGLSHDQDLFSVRMKTTYTGVIRSFCLRGVVSFLSLIITSASLPCDLDRSSMTESTSKTLQTSR
jgi:hypothetical protein